MTCTSVVAEQLGPPLTSDEVHRIGAALDRWLAEHAEGPFGRDEITLAALVLVESRIHNGHLEPRHHDDLVAPILDHVAPRIADSAPSVIRTLRLAPVAAVDSWFDAAYAHSMITGAILNVLQGRFAAARSHTGRLVFFPTYEREIELRGRWLHYRAVRAQKFRNEPPPLPWAAREAIARVADPAVLRQIDALAEGVCDPPASAEYETLCRSASDALLAHKFAGIDDGEVWGGLTKQQSMAALRPLFLRATRRFFLHQRAFKVLREHFGLPHIEPPRISRRLRCLRGWSHGKTGKVSGGGSGTGRPVGV